MVFIRSSTACVAAPPPGEPVIARGNVNTYSDVIRAVEALPYEARDQRERLWNELRAPLKEAHTPETYEYCPVCENQLDWAWCGVCSKYR